MKEFLKNTIVGGAVFLLPVALVGFILSRALRLTKGVAEPLAKGLQLDQLGSVAGMGAAAILSVLMLVLVSFAAGFAARTAVGRRITRWSENSLLGNLQQYHLMKSMDGRSRASRKRERPEAGAGEHRGWLANRIPDRAAGEQLGRRVSATGPDTHVGEHHVSSG
jgi:hypothetical protein